MFNNAHPNILKSSIKFYQREKHALNQFYHNSENEYNDLFNYDNINDHNQVENNKATINNLHNKNSNNNKFLFDKEEYKRLTNSLYKDENKFGTPNKNNHNSSLSISSYANNNNNKINNNYQLNNIDEEKKILEKKYFKNIAKKYLSESERNEIPNPLFIELYKNQNDFDILFYLNSEQFSAHKIVILSQSQTVKEISININGNSKGTPNENIKMNLPNYFQKDIFKEILKWLYCKRINSSGKLDIFAFRDMLLMANELQISELEKILIVKHIIPNMNRESCLIFLKDSSNPILNEVNSKVWKLLGQFSLVCVAKNFSFLIKNCRNQIMGMDQYLLFISVEEALYHASDINEIQNIIKLVIETDYAFDIFELIYKLSKNFINARNFNSQNFDIKPILEKLDYLKPIELPIINDLIIYSKKNCNINGSSYPCGHVEIIKEKFNNCKSNNFNKYDPKRTLNFNNNKLSNALDTNPILEENENLNSENKHNNINFNKINEPEQKINLELAKNKIGIMDEFNFMKKNEKFDSPSNNTINPSDINLRNTKPNFTFQFYISEDLLDSCTIISDAFNTKSNCWNLKLDINKDTGDVSIFLVERGLPISLQKNTILPKKNALRFTSVLFEIEVKDISFEKSFVLYFSYLLNQNQIIGYENFFNLNQLEKKDRIFLNIWIREFPFHSACLQYISDNFQSLVHNLNNKNENDNDNNPSDKNLNFCHAGNDKLALNINQVSLGNMNNNLNNESIKYKNDLNLNNSKNVFHQNVKNEIRSLLNLSVHDIIYILYNDNLNIENENLLLCFILKYSNKKNIKDIDRIMNTIRYRYIDFKMLCITARDHKNISKSVVFKKYFDYEIKFRISKEIHFPYLLGNKQ